MSVSLLRALATGAVLLIALAGSAASDDTLFGLVDTGELFVSSDAGVTWAMRSTLPVRDAVGLLGGMSATELHLVSRTGSVYLSVDGGVTWSAVGTVLSSDVVAVDFAPRSPLPFVVLTASGLLWGSLDGATPFSAVGTLTASDHVSLTHGAGGILYALTETGTVRESADGGGTWFAKGVLPVSDAVEIESFGTALLVLTGTGDIWRSTDAGGSWSAVGTLSQVHMSSMVQGGAGLLIASTREGEVATSVDGMSWNWVGAINQLNVVALATDLPPTGVEVQMPSAGVVHLSSPHPNPRHGPGGSWFEVRVPGPYTIHLSLHDVRGRRVITRAPETFASGGVYTVRWDPGVLPSGSYFVRMTTDSGLPVGTGWTLVR